METTKRKEWKNVKESGNNWTNFGNSILESKDLVSYYVIWLIVTKDRCPPAVIGCNVAILVYLKFTNAIIVHEVCKTYFKPIFAEFEKTWVQQHNHGNNYMLFVFLARKNQCKVAFPYRLKCHFYIHRAISCCPNLRLSSILYISQLTVYMTRKIKRAARYILTTL